MLAISPNGDGFCGNGALRGDDADVPGEAHDIGMHLRRLLGRPWLCTGSNSKDLLSVAHAMVLLLSVVAQRSRAYPCVPCATATDTQSCGPWPPGGWGEGRGAWPTSATEAREGEREKSASRVI